MYSPPVYTSRTAVRRPGSHHKSSVPRSDFEPALQTTAYDTDTQMLKTQTDGINGTLNVHNVLQRFDTVYWAAGRASGL